MGLHFKALKKGRFWHFLERDLNLEWVLENDFLFHIYFPSFGKVMSKIRENGLLRDVWPDIPQSGSVI